MLLRLESKWSLVNHGFTSKAGPLPTFEDIQVPLSQLEQTTRSSSPKSPPALPILTPQDKAKFVRLFNNCKPINGLLAGMSHFSPTAIDFKRFSNIYR